MVGFYEYGDESSGSTECGEFFFTIAAPLHAVTFVSQSYRHSISQFVRGSTNLQERDVVLLV